MLQVAHQRIVTPIDWVFAPTWLTVDEACQLSWHDLDTMLWTVRDGPVGTKRDGDTWLVGKESLWEFQEVLALVSHWSD